MSVQRNVYILGLRQQVVFPAIRTSVTIPPQTFQELVEFCEKQDKPQAHIGVVAFKATGSAKVDEELYKVGTFCRIAAHAKSTTTLEGGREHSVITLSIEGQCRFEIDRFKQTSPFYVADVRLHKERDDETLDPEVEQLTQTVREQVSLLIGQPSSQGSGSAASLRGRFGSVKSIKGIPPSTLADMLGLGLVELSLNERQQVLSKLELKPRLKLVLDLLEKAAEVHRLSKEIDSKMRKRSEDELRETVLLRQLQALKSEMNTLKNGQSGQGGKSDTENDFDDEEEGEEQDDIGVLRETLRKARLSPEAEKIAQRELRRLQHIQPQHAEYTVSKTYLETLAGLPWAESSKDELDINEATAILEKDHYGLEKVKRRILEFLAVQRLRRDMKGPILCLHGPPGVGKTSLGRSVARALGRKFHRIALGGVRDEAELRGHRRTYIGSMPGTIIQALASVKVNNPVILLDEIDKLTRNAMFNPSGAMLELLDPEQNNTFKDHYLNTPFDLSKVLFLCTCNDLHTIDRPLLDRMEVIELSGYTVEEKVHIATTHLLPKQRRLHALEQSESACGNAGPEEAAVGPDAAAGKQACMPDEPRLVMSQQALVDMITKWTMESGVRSLERRIAQLCRWAALRLAGQAEAKELDHVFDVELPECGPNSMGQLTIEAHHLSHILGADFFESDPAERLTVGVSMGLGVTPTGGQLLFVEATRTKGCGRLTVTGQLGEVMRESVSTAMSLLRSKIYYAVLAASGEPRSVLRVGPGSVVAADYGAPLSRLGGTDESPNQFLEVFNQFITSSELLGNSDRPGSDGKQRKHKDPFSNDDVHVHFPAGATPKDGPSAGIATTLALASLLLSRPVRSDTAVTGEITLRGHVLPVGGIRDKILAAHRVGLRHVLLPYGNQRHAKDEIPASAMGDMELHFVKHIDEALAWAFADNVKPWGPVVSANTPTASPTFALKSKL